MILFVHVVSAKLFFSVMIAIKFLIISYLFFCGLGIHFFVSVLGRADTEADQEREIETEIEKKRKGAVQKKDDVANQRTTIDVIRKKIVSAVVVPASIEAAVGIVVVAVKGGERDP